MKLVTDVSRGQNLEESLATLNTRVLGPNLSYNPPPGLDPHKYHMCPITVSTNMKKLALDNLGVLELAKQTGNPVFAIFAKVKSTCKEYTPADFRKLAQYPQKTTKACSRILLTLGCPIILIDKAYLAKIKIG